MQVAQVEEEIVFFGCGDIGPVDGSLKSYSDLVREPLKAADLRVAQCERLYTNLGNLQVHSNGRHSRLPPEMISVFEDCRFDVVSLASNHAMDWGEAALLDTIANFKSRGIKVIGAGPDLSAARAPAIVERRGVKVALLAYCSILRDGYAATKSQPGVAPLRSHTFYEPREYQPGTPPNVVTVPYQDDLSDMLDDVAAARRLADVVVLWLHWGIHYIPKVVADYQVAIASAASQAGVDLIVGHHAHIPKPIAMYGKMPCFFSIGNFIMSYPANGSASQVVRRYGVELDPLYPRLPFGVDAKRALIAKAVMNSGGIRRTSFIPVLIDTELRPEILSPGDARFEDAVQYMDGISDDFAHTFSRHAGEVEIT
jgi:hypothetical protein